jgi:hypothetical protein
VSLAPPTCPAGMHSDTHGNCLKDYPPCYGQPTSPCSNALTLCPAIDPCLHRDGTSSGSSVECTCSNSGADHLGARDRCVPFAPDITIDPTICIITGNVDTDSEWDCYNLQRCLQMGSGWTYEFGAFGCGHYTGSVRDATACPGSLLVKYSLPYTRAQWWWPYWQLGTLAHALGPIMTGATETNGYCALPFVWTCPPNSNMQAWENCCADEIPNGATCPPGKRMHPVLKMCVGLAEDGVSAVIDHIGRALFVDAKDQVITYHECESEIGPEIKVVGVVDGSDYHSAWINLSAHHDDRAFVVYVLRYLEPLEPPAVSNTWTDYEVYVVYTDNRGDDWAEAVKLFSNAILPRSFSDHNIATDVFTAITPQLDVLGNLTGSRLSIRTWPAGETAPVTSFDAKLKSGASLIDLQPDFDSYQIFAAEVSDGRWVFIGRLYGATDINILYSTDQGKTWKDSGA